MCLDGLLNQTYPNDGYEILIIENASKDRTREIGEAYIRSLPPNSPNMRMLCIEHVNLSVSRNIGIRNASGNFIAYIDGDAVPEPTWIEELVKPLRSGADYVGGRINLLNIDSSVARFLQRTRNRQFFGPHIFEGHFVGCNMAFRKEIFDKVGGFYENFVARGDESTLHERICGRFSYAPAPEAVVLHERPDTVIKSVRTEWKSAILSNLCAKASKSKMHWKVVFLFLEQFLMTIFPLLLCIVWFAPGILSLPLALTTFAVIRRLYFRPLNRAIAKGLIGNYGFFRGFFAHILFCFSYNILYFFGSLISPWLYRNMKIIPPMTTDFKVLKAFVNEK
ncbi:glycosyltransferases [Candidatus Scalindua japonica]|uniref:Glycosyltransferases n=2 Tax=Candidatus Scalindua japonica TaxID=1284222 RepID=A0A286U480_9BACT|nr:glycosyltransferases [Candidatus Scalindua japonica]